MSTVAALDMMNLWSVPSTQISVDKTDRIEVRPTNTLDVSTPIEFEFTTAPTQYVMFGESYLYMRFKFDLKDDKGQNASFSQYEAINPANNFMHSMISSVEVELNDKMITHSPQNYAYRAFLEAEMGYSNAAKSSYLKSQWRFGWKYELQGKGYVQGKETRGSTPVDVGVPISNEVYGRIHTDLTFQPKALPGGLKYRIRLILNSTKFMFKLEDNSHITLKLEEAIFYPKIQYVTDELYRRHQSAFKIQPAKYFITRTECKANTFPIGTLDASIEQLASGQLPRRVFIILVSNEAYNGSTTSSALKLEHFKLKYLQLFINGRPVNDRPFEPDFTKAVDQKKLAREYMALYDVLDQNGTDPYIELSQEDFGKSPIFAFNLGPDQTNGAGVGAHLNVIQTGKLRLQAKFSELLNKVVTVLALMEYDNYITIDQHGIVNTNYN